VRVRRAAARALAAARPPEWDLRLSEALRGDPSVWVRWECARALGVTVPGGGPALDKRATDTLVAVVASDTPLVAAAAARTLGLRGGSEDALAAGVRSASPLVRDACAAALAETPKPGRVLERLTVLLDDPRPGARAAAARAIGPTGVRALGEEHAARLAALLSDEEPVVRAAAAECLAGGPDDVLAALIPLLDDHDPRARLAAAVGLLRREHHVEAAVAALRTLVGSSAPLRDPDGIGLSTVGQIAAKHLPPEKNQ
jgi:HEAT repeat protein